jgi:kelch repeat/BTB domain-containing protein 3
VELAMDNSYNLNEQSSWNGISSEKKKNYLASEDHGQKILSVLQSFREQNVFYDFKIIMKEEIIPCHRCVLAACSDFFRYCTPIYALDFIYEINYILSLSTILIAP